MLGEYAGSDPEEIAALKRFSSDISQLNQAAADWYQGKSLYSTAAENHVGGGLLAAAIQAALHPFLVVCAEGMLKIAEQDL